jgi:uncharacterized protein YeaO (DUF488 family)
MRIVIKRIYEPSSASDGYRVLIDRLWPRGISKEKADLSEWNKDLAPSTELRVGFHRHTERWADFVKKYREELQRTKAAEKFLEVHKHEKIITLLYATQDTAHTHALVLQAYLQDLQTGQ